MCNKHNDAEEERHEKGGRRRATKSNCIGLVWPHPYLNEIKGLVHSFHSLSNNNNNNNKPTTIPQ